MRRTFWVAVGLLLGLGGAAFGMGGNLDQPSISIPTDPKTKEADPVTKQIAEVLLSHRKDFTGGWFINSHSVLYFAGGVDGINSLLGSLAKIEGATLQVSFSKDAGVTRRTFPSNDAAADRPCDCMIDHLGWGDARVLRLTIYLGGGRIDPDKLELPAVKGQAAGAGK